MDNPKLLKEQIDWEEECSQRGAERYRAQQDRLVAHGQGETTDVMKCILRERLEEVAAHLEESTQRGMMGVGGNYNGIIRLVSQGDYLKLAFLGLRSIIRAVQIKEKNSLLKVCLDIASRIEIDLKCQMFEAAHPAYYDTVRKSFASQNVTDYVHKQKVMMKKFNEFELEWTDWTINEKVHISMRIIRSIIHVLSDLVFVRKEHVGGVKTLTVFDTTVAFDDWAKEFENERALLFPMFLPLKIPPVPWKDVNTGGYYTPRLRMNFIKTKGRTHREHVEGHTPQAHFDAVNKIQNTAWKINKVVLKVQEEVYKRGLGVGVPSNEKVTPPLYPPHLKEVEREDLTPSELQEVKDWKMIAKACYGLEQQRKGKVLAFMQGHKLAQELRDWDKFYYVYNCDFRGRIYCTTAGLTPQGADSAKGLLQFATEVVLGKDGVKWLAIHGANTFGEDKVSFQARVQWVKEHETYIKQVVSDPISYINFWGNADKPYQFLAFCFEWAKCDYGRNTQATSSIPVGLDGSCNGLQHFSAMLRDSVGAEATNLTKSKTGVPADIYNEVAQVTTEKLKKMDDPRARLWLKVGVTRKCAKRPVMTLPYGATQKAARSAVLEYAIDNWSKFGLPDSQQWDMTRFLTPILWESIGEVVIAARAAMNWLQNMTNEGYKHWLTPIGFPVYQYYKDVKHKTVITQLNGSIELVVRDFDREGVPKASQQRTGVSPNFIHSVDSTHMVMTINATNVDSFAMIHDDFGTHAGNTELLYRIIREQFKELYTSCNPLEEWAKQNDVDVRFMPPIGSYSIDDITSAEYFFG